MRVKFQLNKTAVEIEAEADERLVNVLRNTFSLQSMKKSCMQGICGSCTVLFDNHPVPSCMIPLFSVEGKEIVTLELFQTTEEYHRIMSAFEGEGITLCGFCTAGTVFTAYNLLQKHSNPSEAQIRQAYIGTVCRCTDIASIVAALKRLCRLQRSGSHEK